MLAVVRFAVLFACVVGSTTAAWAQTGLVWQTDLAAAQQLAAQSNRLVLVHVGAPWCGPCVKLEKQVFTQPGFGAGLDQHLVPVKINIDDHKALVERYGIERIPCDLIVTPDGQLVRKVEVSPATAEAYQTTIAQAVATVRGTAPPTAAPAPSPGSMPPHVPVAGPTAVAAAPAAPLQLSDDRYAAYFQQRGLATAAPPASVPVSSASPPAPAAGPVPPSVAVTPPSFAAPPVGSSTSASGVAPPTAAPAQPPRYAPPGGETPRYQPPASAPAPRYTTPAPVAASPTPASATAPSANPPATTTPAAPATAAAASGSPAAPVAAASKPADAAPTTSDAIPLPPGCPPVVLEGYCAVTLCEKRSWTPGDVRYGAIHRGRTYLFQSPAEQQRFLANPDRYSPVISGNDPVVALDEGRAVPGTRRYGLFYENRIYLFSSEESLARFSRAPNRYAAEIIQAMR